LQAPVKYVKKSALSVKRNKLAAILSQQIGSMQAFQDADLMQQQQQQLMNRAPAEDSGPQVELDRVQFKKTRNNTIGAQLGRGTMNDVGAYRSEMIPANA